MALVAGNYEGRERATAYGILGGIAGAGDPAGPILGGWMTTYLTWRLVFVGEVVVSHRDPGRSRGGRGSSRRDRPEERTVRAIRIRSAPG